MTAPTLRYLSLGAGRQSTALYLLACDGHFGDARPSVAIFADTQDEPADVYRHLERLERDFGHVIPIERVTKGQLSAGVYSSKSGRRFAAPPLFVRNRDGEKGMLRRQCTREFKIEPIQRRVRELLGVPKRFPVPRGVIAEAWQGITTDEATRMRTSRERWVRNRYPLALELGWTARDCEAYNARRGYPAAKSACVFCPFTDDARWRDMRANRPAEFAAAVAFDRRIREGANLKGVESESYVHSSLVPLDEVDLSTAEERGQVNLFENECEGMCGV